jgi:hypothetical protein
LPDVSNWQIQEGSQSLTPQVHYPLPKSILTNTVLTKSEKYGESSWKK